MRARQDFDEGRCTDQVSCKVQFFTVSSPFGFGEDEALFLSGRKNDTILTFDPPFELKMDTPNGDWKADGANGGMWALYGMKVKLMADDMQVIDSGLAFIQKLVLTIHWPNLMTAAEACKKMTCRLGMTISQNMAPPEVCSASCSSGVGPSALEMVPAQQALPAVPILVPENQHGNANPWLSMVDY